MFATTFLLTPVCAANLFQANGTNGSPSALVQLALLAFGCVWLRAAHAPAPRVLQRIGALPRPRVLLWAALLMAAAALPWPADIAYGGDEHYHLKSLLLGHKMSGQLVEHGWFAILLIAWLATGFWGTRKLWKPHEPSLTSQANLPTPALLWAFGGLVLAACGPWLVSAELRQDAFLQDRLLRYPASQIWLGAWLWELTRGEFGRALLFGFEVLRFTPVLAVLLLGLVWMQDHRWQRARTVFVLLCLLVLVLTPTLLYHTTLLYLELALLPLLFLLLRATRRWLLADPARLRHTDAWWAALALGFLKETGIIAIGLLWLARAGTRAVGLMRRRELNAAAVAAELRVAFVVLGPGLLYLLLRTWYGARPYQPHLENVWATANWQHAATSLIVQFGWLWLPALVGGVLLIQRREWAKALALTVSFGGMALFHILEEPRWIGLARFNLLLLPAVLVLAADGLIPLATRRNLAAPLLLGLVFGQVALSPVDRRGDRAIWGGSGERWYDYSLCLSELRQLKPDGRLATANMSLNYGLMMELQRQDWHTEPLNFSVTNANDALVTLRAALMDAQKARIDFVIFRWDGTPEVPRDFQHGSYVRWRDYPSPGGTLTAFVRIDSVPLPATPAQSKP